MNQCKILLMPGMGDIYWVFVKLKSFIERNGLQNVHVYTWENQPHKLNRSEAYIKRFPHVQYGGAYHGTTQCKQFNDLYFGLTHILRDYDGFDYVLSMNGLLRNGHSIEYGLFNEYDTDWFFPMTDSIEQAQYGEMCKQKYGEYIVAYFSDDGMFKTWLKSFPPQYICTTLCKLHGNTGCRIILSGGGWDKQFVQQIRKYGSMSFVDEVFDTTTDQLFGMIDNSQGMIGWCGGNTMKSTYFKKPTLMLWSQYFQQPGFYVNCVSPQSYGNWYDFEVVERTHPDAVVSKMLTLMRNK